MRPIHTGTGRTRFAARFGTVPIAWRMLLWDMCAALGCKRDFGTGLGWAGAGGLALGFLGSSCCS